MRLVQMITHRWYVLDGETEVGKMPQCKLLNTCLILNHVSKLTIKKLKFLKKFNLVTSLLTPMTLPHCSGATDSQEIYASSLLCPSSD